MFECCNWLKWHYCLWIKMYRKTWFKLWVNVMNLFYNQDNWFCSASILLFYNYCISCSCSIQYNNVIETISTCIMFCHAFCSDQTYTFDHYQPCTGIPKFTMKTGLCSLNRITVMYLSRCAKYYMSSNY